MATIENEVVRFVAKIDLGPEDEAASRLYPSFVHFSHRLKGSSHQGNPRPRRGAQALHPEMGLVRPRLGRPRHPSPYRLRLAAAQSVIFARRHYLCITFVLF